MTKKKTLSKKTPTSARKKKTAGTATSTAVSKALGVIEKALSETASGKLSVDDAVESRLCEMLDERDLLMIYSIRLVDKDGNEVLSNKGYTPLAQVGGERPQPEAPTVLERVYRDSIWRPIRNKFMEWTNRNLKDGDKPVTAMEVEYGGHEDGTGPLGLPTGPALSG